MNESKPDQGLRLTPTCAANLILELVPRDKWFSKSEIIEYTRPIHHERGGVDGGQPKSTYKTALSDLRKQGKVEFNDGRNVGARYKIPTNFDSPSTEPLRPVDGTDSVQADDSLKGLRLTCEDAKKMTLYLESLSVWRTKREVAAMVVDEYHRRGGTEATTTSESLVKSALSQLRNEGRVELSGSGSAARWRTSGPKKLPSPVLEPKEVALPAQLPASRTAAPVETVRDQVDKFAGNFEESDGYIYVIYESPKEASTHRNDYHTVRIGMSKDRSSLYRVKQHIVGGIPGARRCGLVYFTPRPRQYEAVLHNLLAAKGRKIGTDEGGSREWFQSSAEEVERILTILGNLIPDGPA